jgi:hypothetical protein
MSLHEDIQTVSKDLGSACRVRLTASLPESKAAEIEEILRTVQ